MIAVTLMTSSAPLVGAYQSTEYDFSINFPAGWTQTQNSDVAVLYTNNDGTASINIIVEETSYTLDDYVAASKNQLSGLDYYELISESPLTIGGISAYELDYVWTLTDGDTQYDLQDKQVFITQNNRAYIITCDADYNEYDTYEQTFEQTIQSFRLVSASISGMPQSSLLAIIGVAAAVIVVVVALVLWRRRKPKTQKQAGTPGLLYPPPPPPPPPKSS